MWGATLVLFAALFLTEEAPAHPDLTEAQDMIAHAIEEDPENAALYLRRGTLETKSRDWDAAVASWLKAASLGADRNITDVALANALRESGLNKAALAAAEIALDRDDRNGPAYLARAQIHQSSGRDRECADDFRRAVELIERPQPGMVLLAMDAQRARPAAASVAGLAPLDNDSPERPGETEDLRRRNVLAALDVADAAQSKLGPIAAIQERALELELELGRYDRALERIDTLIAQAPKHPIWVARRAEILEADGKVLAAAEGYQQAVNLIAARPPDRRSDKLAALEIALRKKLAEIRAAEDADRSQGE